MLVTAQSHGQYSFPLGQRQALRTVELAVRAQARVTLAPKIDDGLRLGAAIVSGTSESIWVQLDDSAHHPLPRLQTVCCDGELDVGGARYIFSTNVLSVVDEEGAIRLELIRPGELHVVQRRRFGRAVVHDSSPVRVLRRNSGSEAPWHCEARMMNLSVGGLACLANRADVDEVAVGDHVHVEFYVAGETEAFEFPAVVQNKTPAAHANSIVLGCQLDTDGESEQLKRLHAALGPFT